MRACVGGRVGECVLLRVPSCLWLLRETKAEKHLRFCFLFFFLGGGFLPKEVKSQAMCARMRELPVPLGRSTASKVELLPAVCLGKFWERCAIPRIILLAVQMTFQQDMTLVYGQFKDLQPV